MSLYDHLTNHKLCAVFSRNELALLLQQRLVALLDERDELKEEIRRLKKRPPTRDHFLMVTKMVTKKS